MNQLIKWWPILFRGSLYFGLETLPVLATAFYKFAKGQDQPTSWMLAYIGCNAAYHGCIGLRAYTDNSFHRLTGEIRQHSGDTQRWSKQEKG